MNKCSKCNEKIDHASSYEMIDNKVICGECAYKMGLIDEGAYVKHYCYFIDVPGLRAVIHNNEIYIGTGKFEWERNSRKRECKAYSEWRKAVFERDNYTCQSCGKHGGTLNAHHIKPYAKYEKLRTDIDNGTTLCLDCHRKIHRRERNG